jgi:3-hydroxyisobutyrate dehydrogenase-like beta-hydroxyacid dehydrogenase
MDSVLFIGVGRMGGIMATRLADAGVALAVADIRDEALEPFRARGVAAAATGADLPGRVVFTMLPTGREVREALLGAGGACLSPRDIVVDMSTASPEGTRELGEDLARHGAALLDAPVSGGMAGARDGSLVAMVGGESAVFERVRTLIEMMCGSVTLVGPIGSGHVLKALNNYLSAASLWSASEAFVVGSRLGLDPERMLEVWSRGSGKSHATEVKLPRHVLTRSFDFGQSLEFFCKDIGIAAAIAEDAGVETPGLAAVLANWRAARDELGGADDITAIVKLLEDGGRR